MVALSKQLPKGFILLEALVSLSILTGCALILIHQQQQLLMRSENAKAQLLQSRIMYEEARIILRHDGVNFHTVSYEKQDYVIHYNPRTYYFYCQRDNHLMEVKLEN
ncbi:hypothetical protein [Enterococcus canintestini]|uniref:hypothetical protein n=1 Tax=Enterococcus canintestini TaxID=317010 RepID=UPI00200D027A|nr:hypothetical protein [Enterococcus canintestini]